MGRGFAKLGPLYHWAEGSQAMPREALAGFIYVSQMGKIHISKSCLPHLL